MKDGYYTCLDENKEFFVVEINDGQAYICGRYTIFDISEFTDYILIPNPYEL